MKLNLTGAKRISSMKIMVTGSSGLIGQYLKMELSKTNASTIINLSLTNTDKHQSNYANLDLLQPGVPTQIIKRFKPNILVHLAWISRSPNYMNSDQNKRWYTSSQELIQNFYEEGGSQLIVTGSCAEYAKSTGCKIKETDTLDPTTPFQEYKIKLLEHIESNFKQEKYIWLRPFYVFDLFNYRNKILNNLIAAVRDGKNFELSSPNSRIDFISAFDVANIISQMIKTPITGIYNIGTGSGILLGDLASYAYSKSKAKYEIKYGNNEPQNIVADNSKLISSIGEYNFESVFTHIDKYWQSKNE